jgi:hypothetical protein
MIELAGDFSETEVGGGKYIRRVYLTFLRRGLWLGATEVESASQSTGNPAVMTTTTFTDTANIPMPYDARLTFDNSTDSFGGLKGYVLFQNAANKLFLDEAESQTLGANTDSFAVSNSSAGNVARMKSNVSGGHSVDGSFSMPTGTNRAALFCVAKNISPSTVDWDIQCTASIVGDTSTQAGPVTVIEAGDNTIQPVFLGNFTMPVTIENYLITCTRSAPGLLATDDLYIDYIVGIALDENARIIYLNDDLTHDGSDTQYYIEHQLSGTGSWAGNTHYPLVWGAPSGDEHFPPYEGDAVLAATGNLVSCITVGGDDDWVIRSATDGEYNITLQATRTLAYLTPP